MDAASLLSKVEDGITVILTGGQSYKLPNGQEYTRANLAELRKLRDDLKSEVAQEGGVYVPLSYGRPH